LLEALLGALTGGIFQVVNSGLLGWNPAHNKLPVEPGTVLGLVLELMLGGKTLVGLGLLFGT
jgi:hypothetical protein